MITVVNRAPGMHRAGVAHPAVKSYPDKHFTTEQLLTLVREPMFTVLRGVLVTEVELLEIQAEVAKAEAKAEAAKATAEQNNPPEKTAGTGPAAGEGKSAAGKKA